MSDSLRPHESQLPGLSVHQLRLNNWGLTLPLGCFPGWVRFPKVGNGNLLRYPCLENPMNREAWWATIPRVSWSRTWLKRLACIQGLEGGTLIPEDCGLIKRGRERSFALSFMWEHARRQLREASPKNDSVVTFDLMSPVGSTVSYHPLLSDISLLASRIPCILDFSCFFTSHYFLSPLLVSLLLSEVLTLDCLQL